jgi:hypothetical protein
VNFCPHCHSGNDPVLKDTTWSCGVRFNDSTWRTKECFKRNLESANDRIKQLEESENRMLNWLTEDCPEAVKKQLSNAWMKSKEAKP